jgi:hypothetical protein
VDLYVLAAVHGRADGKLRLRVLDRRGVYGAHEDLGLALVAVLLEDWVVLVVEGGPLALGEVGDVEHPVGEQLHVRLPIVRIVGSGGDELVDGPVFFVVTGVDDDLPESETVMAAFSCLTRPSQVCLRGLESGSKGSISTIQP